MEHPKTTYTKIDPLSCHHIEYDVSNKIEKRKNFLFGLPVIRNLLSPARTLHMLTYINYPIAHTRCNDLHDQIYERYIVTMA